MSYFIVVDGLPYGLAYPGLSSVTSYADVSDPGVTIVAGALEIVSQNISERLRPLDGDCEVSALNFVIHDVEFGGSFLGATNVFTRGIAQTSSTWITAGVLTADTTMVVADPSLFTPATAIHPAWIGQECVMVTAKAGSTITVTRGVYGSRAQDYTYDDAAGITQEIYLAFPWLSRRRVTLFRVVDGVATTRWIGYLEQAPRLNADGASWTISATHSWQRESKMSLASAVSGARNAGFDTRAVVLRVLFANGQGAYSSSGRNSKSVIRESFDQCMFDACASLRSALTTAGATNVHVAHTYINNSLIVSCSADGLDDFSLSVTVGDLAETGSSNSLNNKRASVTLAMPRPTALTCVARPFGNASDRYTALSPALGMPTANSSWVNSNAGYGVEVRSVAVLSTDTDDGTIELDPREQSAGTVTLIDSTVYDPSRTSFKARARYRAKDPSVEDNSDVVSDIVLRKSYQWKREFLVESDHWLYGLRWLIEDRAQIRSASDSRNWTWSRIDRVAGATGSGVMAGANWRVLTDRKTGEFFTQECKLRGACVAVVAGKLSVVAIRPPTASETSVATITNADLYTSQDGSQSVPQWEQWDDGLITSVQVNSPLRELRVNDTVSLERHGEASTLELNAEGLRGVRALADDPLAFCRMVAQRALRQWSDPVYKVIIPLTAAFVGTLSLGDTITVTQPLLPDGLGSRGMSSVKARVIAIDEPLTGNSPYVVEALLFVTSYGYAPCARVASIAGAVLTLASGYASTASDYAASGAAWYTQTANDKGAGWFSVGDKVRLQQRDTTTYTVEEHEVLSVNASGGTITLVSAPSAPWAGYSIVDVLYSAFGNCTSTQKAKFAFISDDASPPVIDTSNAARKWAP